MSIIALLASAHGTRILPHTVTYWAVLPAAACTLIDPYEASGLHPNQVADKVIAARRPAEAVARRPVRAGDAGDFRPPCSQPVRAHGKSEGSRMSP
ncbi:hypothetical protein ACH4XT_31115 [Streptomyces avidinii]|uniref:hypothetical protein n=1 Tax=Streptomyces avidinii TaxID=1895 RepID=UPI00379C07BF